MSVAPKVVLNDLRGAMEEFKAKHNESVHHMRKRVEVLLRSEQTLKEDLDHARDTVEEKSREAHHMREDIQRKDIRQRKLEDDLKRAKRRVAAKDVEGGHLREEIDVANRECEGLRKEVRELETKSASLIRKVQDSEALAHRRRSEAESLSEQLRQVRTQLHHSTEEVEMLRRQRQQESQNHEARVSLLMNRIVQAERAKKERFRQFSLAEAHAQDKLNQAAQEAKALRAQGAERDMLLANKRELFTLRSKQKEIEEENKMLLTKVAELTSERNLLRERLRKISSASADVPPLEAADR